MDGFDFLGVYSGTSPKENTFALEEPPLWNVYLKKNHEVYIIQKLDENNQATHEQYKIAPTYFGINFRRINNTQLKRKVEKQVKTLAPDNDKHESFFASFFKSNSAFGSIFQNQNTNEPKQSGEFNLKLRSDNPVSDPRNDKERSVPSHSSDIKKSQEFAFSLNKEVPAAKPKEETFSTDVQTKNTSNKTKNYSQNNKETDQHPFDEKFSLERFGLDTILSNLDDPKKQPQNGAELINNRISYNPISKEFHPHAKLSSPSVKEEQLFTVENEIPTSSKPDNTPIVKVENNTAESVNKTPIITVGGQSEEKENSTHITSEKINSSETNKNTKDSPINEDELLPAKGNKSLSFSEKALRLDRSLRKEFQVSMNHWNMSKKNMALRQFHAIINKEASFVPAHKHMFTDFAIQLRKINQHDLALVAAIRCTKLSPDDSHAFFNVSRLYYELGRYEKANEYIDKTLGLEAKLAPALRLSSTVKECLRRKSANR